MLHIASCYCIGPQSAREEEENILRFRCLFWEALGRDWMPSFYMLWNLLPLCPNTSHCVCNQMLACLYLFATRAP